MSAGGAVVGRLRSAVFLASLGAGLLAGACGDGSGPEGPVPGVAVVSLQGAAADDRAVLLEIGPGATGVLPGGTGLTVHSRASGTGFVVAVFGPLASGPVIRIEVPDKKEVPTIQVREVARETGELRVVLSGYAARVDEVR